MCQRDKTKMTFQSINVQFLTDFFAAGMDAPGYGGMNRLGGGRAVADSHMSCGAMTHSCSVLFLTGMSGGSFGSMDNMGSMGGFGGRDMGGRMSGKVRGQFLLSLLLRLV